MNTPFVIYLRVSTGRQGESGLGLEAQREAVSRYVASVGGKVIGEYVEVESGKRNDRPVLMQSIAACRRESATLLIAKLDRLSRSVHFIAGLMESKVPFVAVDMPFATPLLLHVMAAFAQHEREQISLRTKAALAAAKARGVQLGVNGRVLAGRNRADADAFAHTMAEAVSELRAAGATTLHALADGLNVRGVKTREGARWTPQTVHRLVTRLAA
jgi:DNA invertase Pin-like site-specific DNA recombinase